MAPWEPGSKITDIDIKRMEGIVKALILWAIGIFMTVKLIGSMLPEMVLGMMM